MRTIIKGTEPPYLTVWKRKNPHKKYEDLDGTEEGKSIRATIRGDVLKEQFYLCASLIAANESKTLMLAIMSI